MKVTRGRAYVLSELTVDADVDFLTLYQSKNLAAPATNEALRKGDRIGKAGLQWAANKLLLGAGATSSPTEVPLPVTATKEKDIPVCLDLTTGAAAASGEKPSVELSAATHYCRFRWKMPHDFTTLTKAVIVFYPIGTGTIDITVAAAWGKTGEANNVHTDSATQDGLAVVTTVLQEVDIGAALTGVEADDHIGVKLTYDAEDGCTAIWAHSIHLEYA